ncbi:MAG: ABC transporter substrate-binding protein [Anaerolineae bacterium]|nr:ABC transporter substrate-binding protein [Anaerolineae bacterium]
MLVFVAFLTLTVCLPPSLPRVIKIGLVAPFEGRYRYVGYDAIYAARLAVREINAASGAGGWSLELVAYDDRADAEFASAAARNLVIDPDVVAVIGHYQQASTDAASVVYAEVGMPLLAVGAWLTPVGASTVRESLHEDSSAPVWHMLPSPEQMAGAMVEVADISSLASPPVVVGIFPFNSSLVEGTFLLTSPPSGGTEGGGVWHEGTLFVTPYPLPRDLPGLEVWNVAYRTVGPHVPDPGIYALPTYEAVYALAEAIATVVESGERPSRVGVAAALPGVRRDGALGTISWDTAGYWQAMPLYVYVWEQASARLLDGRQ